MMTLNTRKIHFFVIFNECLHLRKKAEIILKLFAKSLFEKKIQYLPIWH